MKDEVQLDTERIQKAMDTCGKGKAVALHAHGSADAFVSGPLELRDGVTLVIDKGTTLFESINPEIFAMTPGSCGLLNDKPGAGCKPFISATNVSSAGIMGDGVIDGRGGIKLLGRDMSAWEIAQKSLSGGKRLSRLLVAKHADNFTLYRITFQNSEYFNVSYHAGDGFTAWGVKIDTPHREGKSSKPLARNTDGIDPGDGSKNITITHCYLRTGDDNIAIKGGPGGVTNMTVSHNHFYWGHGMSIGSQTEGGVSKIRVSDLTLDGTDSGIRIKSAGDRGGLVRDINYDNICIRNSQRPIDITAAYSDNNATKGNSAPVFREITLREVSISGGGELLFDGYDHDHRTQVTLNGVYLTDAEHPNKPYTYSFGHSDVAIAAGGSNISLPAGEDTTLTGKPSKDTGGLPSCADRFVPFPE
jgi:polygalacturonase